MDLRDTSAILKENILVVDGLPNLCEPEFLRIGDELFAVVQTLGGMQGQMQVLRDRLVGDELAEARAVLESGTATLAALIGGNHSDKAALAELGGIIAKALARIAPLARVIGEIGVLAVNAKIQVAQVTAAGIDFSVFTREISRLRETAADAVERCQQGLVSLSEAIDGASDIVGTFERDHASSLADVRRSLEEGLAELREHDRQAAKAVTVINARSAEIAARINAVIAALQINDITMQRVGHVREALEVIADLAGDEHGDTPLGGREPLVVAAACRLQSAQLSHAAEDFAREVTRVIGELRQLSTATSALVAVAAGGMASGGTAAEDSFIDTVKRDCDRALSLLGAFQCADHEVRSTIATVSGGVQGMADDIEHIRSVEIDMRIMGLNATLKCGRLGAQGRVLAVIAQELRGYGNRTGEDSRVIAGLLTDIADSGARLAPAESGNGGGNIAAIEGSMGHALGMLTELGGSLSTALDSVQLHGAAAAARMAALVDGVHLHETVPSTMENVADILNRLADRLDPDRHAGNHFADEVKALLGQDYTMESERIIHALFADGANVGDNAPTTATESIEEFFL